MGDKFFRNENFRNSSNDEFFKNFTEKIIFVFLTLKDKRNILNYKENVFNKIDIIMIKDPFFQKSNLKTTYQKIIFEKATSKEEIPEPQRSLLFKVYKKLKYNNENYEEEEKEKENIKTYEVDPVNDYILKKSYTNRSRLSKVEKIKLLAQKRKHFENNQKQYKQMELDRMNKLKAEIEENGNGNSSTDDDNGKQHKKNKKLFGGKENENDLSLNSDNLKDNKNINKDKKDIIKSTKNLLAEKNSSSSDLKMKNIPAEEILDEN